MIPTDCLFALPDEGRVGDLARRMGQHLQPPLVLYLHGDLGAGKTTFARALIHGLGYTGRVKSPTYGLLESYTAAGFTILHLDLYRVESGVELDYLAIRDLFDNNSLLLIEWPEKGAGFLPQPDLELNFGETRGQRFVRLKPSSGAGEALMQALLPLVEKSEPEGRAG